MSKTYYRARNGVVLDLTNGYIEHKNLKYIIKSLNLDLISENENDRKDAIYWFQKINELEL